MMIKCPKCGKEYHSLYYDFHSCKDFKKANNRLGSKTQKDSIILKLTLGSIIISIITFWIMQYNEYIAKGNDIKIETANNIIIARDILKDENREWLYLIPFSNMAYKTNWNYIIQYYSNNCMDLLRAASLNVDSINTLIILRQGDDENPQHAIDLHDFTEKLQEQLSNIFNCEPKPMLLPVYRFY